MRVIATNTIQVISTEMLSEPHDRFTFQHGASRFWTLTLHLTSGTPELVNQQNVSVANTVTFVCINEGGNRKPLQHFGPAPLSV